MKKWIFFATLMTLMSVTVKAQFDDVYYDPAKDSRPATTTTRSQNQQPRYSDNQKSSNNDDEYYDNGASNGGGDYYEYDEDYDDYAYSTRIRRFHQPLRGFDYYSTAYVDYGNYDPYYYNRYFSPGVTIIVGNGYWNRWNSYNRWNSWSWFNRYWDDWRYTSYGFCNPSYYASSFYPSWGYSPYGYGNYYGNSYDSYGYSPYGYSSYGYNNWGYNRYNQYNNPYQTGHTTVNTNNTNKYYGPRAGGGAIREVTGPSGQSTGRRNDVGAGTIGAGAKPVRSNQPQSVGTTTNGGVVRRESVPSDGRTETTTDRPTRTYDRPTRTTEATDRPTRSTETTTDRPTRTYDRPAPNYDRPTRSTETTTDRPTRTYDRPTPNYDRPQRTETPRSEPTRETPRYEAPRRETPHYEAPRQESRSYSPPASSPAPARSESSGGSNNSGSAPSHRRGN